MSDSMPTKAQACMLHVQSQDRICLGLEVNACHNTAANRLKAAALVAKLMHRPCESWALKLRTVQAHSSLQHSQLQNSQQLFQTPQPRAPTRRATAAAEPLQPSNRPTGHSLGGTWLHKKPGRAPPARPGPPGVSRQHPAAAAASAGQPAPGRQQGDLLHAESDDSQDLLDPQAPLVQQPADEAPDLDETPDLLSLSPGPVQESPPGSGRASGLMPQLQDVQRQSSTSLCQRDTSRSAAMQPADCQQRAGTAAGDSSPEDARLADSMLLGCSQSAEEQRILAFSAPAFLQQVGDCHNCCGLCINKTEP